MLICSCNVISDHDIRKAVQWMRAADPQVVVTPGKVWRALGKRPDCGGCFDHFIATIAEQIKVEAPDTGHDIPAQLDRQKRTRP